jgi:hypothetical protein
MGREKRSSVRPLVFTPLRGRSIMFVVLLIVTFTIATAASAAVARVFDRPLSGIIARLIPDELAVAWQRYIIFGLFLVGINGGVRIWQFEKYVLPPFARAEPLVLNADRWALEVYRTLMGTLRSVAAVLLVLFVLALVAYIIVRQREMTTMRSQRSSVRSA